MVNKLQMFSVSLGKLWTCLGIWVFHFYWAEAQVYCGNSSNAINVTINNAADATKLASSCPTVWGSVLLGPGSSGDIVLNGITDIHGDLRPTDNYGQFIGTGITSLSSSTLINISGALAVYVASKLQTVTFPKMQNIYYALFIANATVLNKIDLSSVQTGGAWLRLDAVPSLTTFTYPLTINSQVDGAVGITGSALTHLDGFTSSPGAFYMTNNPFLTEVNVEISATTSTQTRNATWDSEGVIIITNNSAAVNVSFPNLVSTAGLIWIDNCSALSIPSLNSVNGSFSLNNATFTSLEAPNLGWINGSMNITGDFTGISGFPALYEVSGFLYLKSSKYIDCSPFQKLSAAGKIKGSFQCYSGPLKPPTAATTAVTSNSSSSSLSKGAKAGIGVGVGIGGLLAIAGVVLIFFRGRNRLQRKEAPSQVETVSEKMSKSTTSELPATSVTAKELDGKNVQKHRLADISTAQELQ